MKNALALKLAAARIAAAALLPSLRTSAETLTSDVERVITFATDAGVEPTAAELAANEAKLAQAKTLADRADAVEFSIAEIDKQLAALKAITGEAAVEVEGANAREAKRGTAEKRFSAGEGRGTGERMLDAANLSPEKLFAAELSAFAAGRELEFTAITVAANQALIPKSVEMLAVRKNLNAFRRLLDLYGYTPTDLPFVQNIDITVIAFADGSDGTENAAATDGTPVPVTLSLAPTMVTSTTVWFSAAITAGPAFNATVSIYPGLQRAVERREEVKWFAALKTQAGADASMIGKTTASTTAITYDEFVDWRNSVGQAYNVDAAFIISVALKGALEKLKDTNGNPILVNGTNGITLIDGKPTIVSDAFEAMTTGKYPGAIISAEAIRIVDAGPTKLAKYEGESAHVEGVGFEVIRYSDCKFVAAGVKLLKMA